MHGFVERFRVVAAAISPHHVQTVGEIADVGGEIGAAGDVGVAPVPISDQPVTDIGLARQIVDAGGYLKNSALDFGNFIGHAAGGVNQEQNIQIERFCRLQRLVK